MRVNQKLSSLCCSKRDTSIRRTGLYTIKRAPFTNYLMKSGKTRITIKSYVNDTAGNKSNSGVPGEGAVFLVRLFKGVTGISITSLERHISN